MLPCYLFSSTTCDPILPFPGPPSLRPETHGEDVENHRTRYRDSLRSPLTSNGPRVTPEPSLENKRDTVQTPYGKGTGTHRVTPGPPRYTTRVPHYTSEFTEILLIIFGTGLGLVYGVPHVPTLDSRGDVKVDEYTQRGHPPDLRAIEVRRVVQVGG